MNLIEFDNCPAPAELYSELHRLKARSGATLGSWDPAGFIPAPWRSEGWTLWHHCQGRSKSDPVAPVEN